MWSYSSCAKLYQKYNVLTVFFIGIEELCTALADNSWLTANPEESFTNYDWMHSPSRTTWWRKDSLMVLDMARPKYKKSTIWLGMRGRDIGRKSTLKVNNLQVFTIDFSEIQLIVNHNSQSDGQSKSAKRWTNLRKEDHTFHLTPEEKKRYQGQWSLTLNKSRQKRAFATSTRFSSCSLSQKPSSSWVRRTGCRTKFSTPIQETALFLKWFMVGHVWLELVELMIKLSSDFFLLQLVSLTVDCDPL